MHAFLNPFLDHLDWLALLVGAVGSFLWAHNGRSVKYASLWWLVSSFLWIAFAWQHGLPALGLRDVLGVSTAVYGCYRWLPHRERLPVIREPARVAQLANS